MRAALVACVLVVASGAMARVAVAQPMMVDPSRMSGIPRPDPQVPAGTITVRLIRGQLTNRVVGTEVTLTSADGKRAQQKTDGEGRATFSGLDGEGPFVASAMDGDKKLESQPIPLSPQMGSRVMLVFAAGGLGAPDGNAHPDKSLPAGTLVVRAEDGAGQAREGLVVELGQQTTATDKVVERKATTDVAGEATFTGLDYRPTAGYAVRIVANGAQFASQPFKLEANMGARVVLAVREVSTDTSALSFAEGTHLLVEVTDDALQVIEVFRLANGGKQAFDGGPAGLHIPLPRDAVQVQTMAQNPSVAVSGTDLVVNGPIPPGDMELRVGFALPFKGDHFDIVQPTPIPFSRLVVVTQVMEGLNVAGHELVGKERDMQGRKIMVYFGGAVDRGGELRVQLTGLPHANTTWRWAASLLALLVVVAFGVYASGGGGAERMRLERKRQALFDDIVKVDAELATASDGRPALEQKRAGLVASLAEVYRGLDELGGG